MHSMKRKAAAEEEKSTSRSYASKKSEIMWLSTRNKRFEWLFNSLNPVAGKLNHVVSEQSSLSENI